MIYLSKKGLIEMREGIYTCIQDIDEDEVKGLKGSYYYNTNTDEGIALRDILYKLFFLDQMNEYKEDSEDIKKTAIEIDQIKQQLANIIDRDLSKILGYEVTIRIDENYTSFDNEDLAGEWIKK